MPESIITTGAALVGAGTWFGEKIFGSSAEAMGGQLTAYLQSRIPAIFGAAETKVGGQNLALRPIRPGLLARMVMDASFSEDSDEITDWWASLFISASLYETNKHAVFSDMMATIGPSEAKCLSEFVEQFDFGRTSTWFLESVPNMRGSVDLVRDQAIAHWVGETPIAANRIQQVYSNLTTGQLPWPLRPIRWVLPALSGDGKSTRLAQTNPWYAEARDAVEILERSRVLKFSKSDVPVMGPSSWVETVELTGLGVDFFMACKGFTTGMSK
jgi:hypothetical protein